MEIEYDVVYRPGWRTFMYTWSTYGWWLSALTALFGYMAYLLYFGSWREPVSRFLAGHADWYMDIDMIAQWTLLVTLSFFAIAFLRVWIMYRQYAFYVDDYAFHLRRGIFRIHEISIPYYQISNVHIEQPYFWRLQGLAQLDITVNNEPEFGHIKKSRDFLIPCIDKPLAKALSKFLIRMTSDEEEEDEDDDEYEDTEDAEDVAVESGWVTIRP